MFPKSPFCRSHTHTHKLIPSQILYKISWKIVGHHCFRSHPSVGHTHTQVNPITDFIQDIMENSRTPLFPKSPFCRSHTHTHKLIPSQILYKISWKIVGHQCFRSHPSVGHTHTHKLIPSQILYKISWKIVGHHCFRSHPSVGHTHTHKLIPSQILYKIS